MGERRLIAGLALAALVAAGVGLIRWGVQGHHDSGQWRNPEPIRQQVREIRADIKRM